MVVDDDLPLPPQKSYLGLIVSGVCVVEAIGRPCSNEGNLVTTLQKTMSHLTSLDLSSSTQPKRILAPGMGGRSCADIAAIF